MAVAISSQSEATALSQDIEASQDQRQRAGQDTGYLSAIAATLSWVLGRSGSPITGRDSQPTTQDIKTERLHAEDLTDQAAPPWMDGRKPSLSYGEGVKSTITWLLGDATEQPGDPADGGFCA